MAEETILDRVMSPSQVVKALAERGIRISERALRERARRIGAFHKIGREILFTENDLERIMRPDPKPKRLIARTSAPKLRRDQQELKAPSKPFVPKLRKETARIPEAPVIWRRNKPKQ